MLVVLVSTYDLGRQPFGLASPAAWLRDAGFDVSCLDVSRHALDRQVVEQAALVAFFLPMHTATRLVEPVIARVRDWNPAARLCAYGLYAPHNAAWLTSLGVHGVLGAEFEAELVAMARSVERGVDFGEASEAPSRLALPRLAFVVPDRSSLPPLSAYARLERPDGQSSLVGYVEASRGCKHLCRHCPVVPVYQGRFRIVPVDVVVADAQQQVDAGARHMTFGDPDFFNGIGHAVRVIEAFAHACPGVSYDVTIKIEHLLRHADVLPRLRDTGCLFVTSAVESIDDDVLVRLEKGHTKADFEQAVALCRRTGLTLAPTFIPFTPWTTVEGYRALLATIAALDLVDSVPSVQLTLRLLIPAGSLLCGDPDVQRQMEPFDQGRLVYPWRHDVPEVDALQVAAARAVHSAPHDAREVVFDRLRALVGAPPLSRPSEKGPRPRTSVPYLNEPWYC